MAKKLKIMFVASEATPFISTGGLAEVIGSLSTTLALNSHVDVRVVCPLYEKINPQWRTKFEYLGYFYVDLAWRHEYCGVYSLKKENVTYYFLDNEHYFKRDGIYGYGDDGERFAYFSKASLDLMRFLKFYPDILHAHDWQAALSVIYLKTNYGRLPEYHNMKTLFTIHNIEYQGQFGMGLLNDTFDIYGAYRNLVEYHGSINLMKGAIECSDRFSTVSPHYAQEIRYAYFAHGLEYIIQKNENKLVGILNGIDSLGYNAKLDTHLFQNYDENDFSGKMVCKLELQKMLNLPERSEVPVIAMITRLVSHKGLDLVLHIMDRLLEQDVQFVLLGTGDRMYEDYFKDLAYRYPTKVSTNIIFNNDLSRKIYAGSDIFLMPSKSEPCGLSQMICSRYGTIPVVRETGGLYDSIKPLENGYTFTNFNADDMLYVISEAVKDYHNKEEWEKLMKRVMETDFSWKKSAEEYLELYLSMM